RRARLSRSVHYQISSRSGAPGGQANDVVKQGSHPLAHSFGVELDANEPPVIALDRFDDPVRSAGPYPEAVAEGFDGLQLPRVDLKAVEAEDFVQQGSGLHEHLVVRAAALLAVRRRPGTLPLDVGVEGTAGEGIGELHPVADAEHRALGGTEAAEEGLVRGEAGGVGLCDLVR